MLANFLAVSIENARNYERKKYESERCPLTNLYNYRYFTNLLENLFSQLRNDCAKIFSIVLLDMDDFKKVNDTYGHEAGNEVLRQLARRLERFVGKKGTVSRYGGEEFVIVFPNVAEEECFQMAEKVRQLVAGEPFYVAKTFKERRGAAIRMTASIGIATAPIHGEDPLSLVRNADRAMYTGAKREGKNRVARCV